MDGAHPAQVLISIPVVSTAALDLLRRETEEVFALWTGENCSTPAEIFEINTKPGEEDAAQFLQPLDPEMCAPRGRSTSYPA